MAKTKIAFFCKECGAEFPKWLGRCTECSAWGSIIEERISPVKKGGTGSFRSANSAKAVLLKDVEHGAYTRISTCLDELNRVLGGGVVPGSLVLLGGEPGIGKSTLALQMVLHSSGIKCLYVSGEESAEQIKMRAERIGIENESCVVYPQTCLESILNELSNEQYDFVVIDSIQTMYSESVESAAGGVSQIRECTVALLKYAKESSVPVFLIGHITKDGTIAGPKILEHIVDVVLQFEGDSNTVYRILRGAKNRFGSTNEIGVFEMVEHGLKEIPNPSEVLLNHWDDTLSGVAVGATIDGVRPYLLEVQSLTSPIVFAMPQRVTTGFENRRLNMLLAVVEKRLGYKMVTKDIFINIAGGFKVKDPGLDLAVLASVLSSLLDIAIPKRYCFLAEVGLSGEVRPASRTESRVLEAVRLGFETVVISSYAKSTVIDSIHGVNVVYISKVEELIKSVLSKL